MNILGVSCFDKDSAACLVRNAQVIAAVEEERLTRRKHDDSFPALAIQSVLTQGGITGEQIDAVFFYESPAKKGERLYQLAQNASPQDQEALISLAHDYTAKTLSLSANLLQCCGYSGPISLCEHLLSHAAAAYFSSPFDEAAILVVDDVGERATTGLYKGKGKSVELVKSIDYPHSLGLLYAALTDFLGFKAKEGEYKVMGLAPYGKPRFLDKLRKLVAFHDGFTFELDLPYFGTMLCSGQMYSDKLVAFFGPPRAPDTPITQIHMDIAASLQSFMEEALLFLTTEAHKMTGLKNLCLSGSVAHNIVANTRILTESPFKTLHIHFASDNSGGAIGAALYGFYQLSNTPRLVTRPCPYLGPAYDEPALREAIEHAGMTYEHLDEEQLVTRVASLLRDSFVVGWYQGRMEFGPRALGNRSILANASASGMKNTLNADVKHREDFRPFAPAVLEEKASDYFDFADESPFMLYAVNVRPEKRDIIPAVTHIDGTARVQTVRRDDNPLFYDLIAKVEELMNIPVILNTSFNVRGEPIVCSPHDALRCFMGTGIDYLALGPFLISKKGAA